MTIMRDSLILYPDVQELIKLFMLEASNKQQLNDGLSKHKQPQIYREVIGLVEVIVAFEAFLNLLDINESKLWKKRKLFSSIYKNFFVTHKDVCKEEIKVLVKELKNEPLKNMTPSRKIKDPIKIDDENSLHQLIEVIYRVRSNMVHGNKTLNSNRNKLLISNSFHLLYKIMDLILKEEKIIE